MGHARSISTLLRAVFLFTGLLSAEASATTLVPVHERDLASQSALAFEGTVTSVRYRLSDARDASDTPIPYTYVTFRVDRILKGRTEQPGTVTLRFVGGPKDRRMLIVSSVPLFNPGDREILFATGSSTHICPLVGWKQGRFRVVDARVYTDDGRAVMVGKGGQLAYGRERELKAVFTGKVGTQAITWTTKVARLDKDSAPNATGKAMAADEFVAYFSTLIKPAGAGGTAFVRDAKIGDVFHAPRVLATAPPKDSP